MRRIIKNVKENSNSFDTFDLEAKTSTSVTLSPTGKGFLFLPISIRVACSSTISDKFKYEIVRQKFIKH